MTNKLELLTPINCQPIFIDPPVIAQVEVLGIPIGEQIPPLAKRMFEGRPVTVPAVTSDQTAPPETKSTTKTAA